MQCLNFVKFVCVLVLFTSAASAQLAAPAGGSDKNLSDRGVKDRSIELERIKREANKPDARNQQPVPAPIAKFEEIKEDFEGLQRRQDEILKAYQQGKQIDLAKIAEISALMNKNAIRLEANLFPAVELKKGKKKSKEQEVTEAASPTPLPQDTKSLIVEQDNSLASFVSNPMFVNPQVANVNDNAKAHTDLKKLILLTAALKIEAEKRPN